MNVLYAVCAVILTLVISSASIYWIVTMTQIRRTARILELFLSHADDTALFLRDASQRASEIMGRFESGWFKTASFLLGLAASLMNKKEKEADVSSRSN